MGDRSSVAENMCAASPMQTLNEQLESVLFVLPFLLQLQPHELRAEYELSNNL
jgi:hypothetical protein